MNWLFVHQGAPAQFVHVARRLADAGHRVVFIGQKRRRAFDRTAGLKDVELETYRPKRRRYADIIDRMARSIENAEGVAKVADALDKRGFKPHLSVGHIAWGEPLFLKDVWPDRPLLGYFERFRGPGAEDNFDPEFPSTREDRFEQRAASAVDMAAFAVADRGVAPTEYQRQTYPAPFRKLIEVIHEGVDTQALYPNPAARVWVGDGQPLSVEDEVLTFCSRSLEPHRGFHTFMRALPEIMRRRPRLQVVIVGYDDPSYSDAPDKHDSYREQMLAEVGSALDMGRIHFYRHLDYHQFVALLQVSTAHVYFSYPFTMSWSLTEAMAIGCLIVGSRTPPVEEAIVDGENGLLVDFFDVQGLADRVCEALEHRHALAPLRVRARETAVRRYDLKTVCLPAHLKLYQRMAR